MTRPPATRPDDNLLQAIADGTSYTARQHYRRSRSLIPQAVASAALLALSSPTFRWPFCAATTLTKVASSTMRPPRRCQPQRRREVPAWLNEPVQRAAAQPQQEPLPRSGVDLTGAFSEPLYSNKDVELACRLCCVSDEQINCAQPLNVPSSLPTGQKAFARWINSFSQELLANGCAHGHKRMTSTLVASSSASLSPVFWHSRTRPCSSLSVASVDSDGRPIQ